MTTRFFVFSPVLRGEAFLYIQRKSVFRQNVTIFCPIGLLFGAFDSIVKKVKKTC